MIGSAYRWLRARAARVYRRGKLLWRGPKLTEADVTTALHQLPFDPPRILLVHSSLSACGYFKGGPAVVINALRAWNQGGTLVFPTHTYCYPLPNGDCPVYDPCHTNSLIGAITNTFWKQPNIRRSLHPTHSLACEGPDSEILCQGHEFRDTPCGQGTPYEQLVDRDAAVLMFGTTLNTYTLFHTAEDAAQVPYLYEAVPLRLKIRQPDGVVRDFPMRRQDMKVTRRFAETADWLEERGLLSRVRCGRGELLWLPHARAVHEAIVKQLRQDPWFLVAAEARPVA